MYEQSYTLGRLKRPAGCRCCFTPYCKQKFVIFDTMNIKNAYNNWAPQYDTNKNKTRDLDARVTYQVLKNYKFADIIELGCGTGKNTLFFS